MLYSRVNPVYVTVAVYCDNLLDIAGVLFGYATAALAVLYIEVRFNGFSTVVLGVILQGVASLLFLRNVAAYFKSVVVCRNLAF